MFMIKGSSLSEMDVLADLTLYRYKVDPFDDFIQLNKFPKFKYYGECTIKIDEKQF